MPYFCQTLVVICTFIQLLQVAGDCYSVESLGITSCDTAGVTSLVNCFQSNSNVGDDLLGLGLGGGNVGEGTNNQLILPQFCNAGEDQNSCCNRIVQEVGYGYSCNYPIQISCQHVTESSSANPGAIAGIVIGVCVVLAFYYFLGKVVVKYCVDNCCRNTRVTTAVQVDNSRRIAVADI